jgi:hypothetical protein
MGILLAARETQDGPYRPTMDLGRNSGQVECDWPDSPISFKLTIFLAPAFLLGQLSPDPFRLFHIMISPSSGGLRGFKSGPVQSPNRLAMSRVNEDHRSSAKSSEEFTDSNIPGSGNLDSPSGAIVIKLPSFSGLEALHQSIPWQTGHPRQQLK